MVDKRGVRIEDIYCKLRIRAVCKSN